MSFADYTEEDKRLHDFVITHNRKLKDIKTIISNIMWELQALTDSFEAFEFVNRDEYDLEKVVNDFGFSPTFNNSIRYLITGARLHQTPSAHKYNFLQPISHKHNLLPNDILKIAKTNFAELCNKQ